MRRLTPERAPRRDRHECAGCYRHGRHGRQLLRHRRGRDEPGDPVGILGSGKSSSQYGRQRPSHSVPSGERRYGGARLGAGRRVGHVLRGVALALWRSRVQEAGRGTGRARGR